MKKYLFMLLAMVMMLPFAMEAKDDQNALNYEIEGAGTGAQGTYLVKVTVITKDKQVADELIKRAAVHGVLFRGFSSAENRQHQHPLAGSAAAETEHADYYNEFFKKNGAATRYASVVGSRSVVKSGKQYRTTATVSVNKDDLRRDLEAAGAMRGLNSAF